ncbi:DUF711 family protein, partial [Campylobacter concisus]|uniref:DUF711 family protein n=1 Tax=Campylobacter concisus TaxID=199 RepID=UPI0021561C3A
MTPISLIRAATDAKDYVIIAKTLDRAAIEFGIDFIGGFSALVPKGYQKGNAILLNSISPALVPPATAFPNVTARPPISVLNTIAVLDLGRTLKDAAVASAMGCAQLVVFVTAVAPNSFLAGRFLGLAMADV